MTVTAETVTVDVKDGSLRLDRWFKRHYPDLGHGQLEKLLRTGRIRVNGKRAKSGDRVEAGHAIQVPALRDVAPPVRSAPQPPRPSDEAMLRAAILHRDEAIIVLNKPPGLAVQEDEYIVGQFPGIENGKLFASPTRGLIR